MLSAAEKRLVDNSVIEMTCTLDTLVIEFYEDLFQRAPQTRKLFSSDILAPGGQATRNIEVSAPFNGRTGTA